MAVIILITAFLEGVKWPFIVILICISLVANDVEHLFKGLLNVCMSSLKKCLLRPFARFLIRLSFCCSSSLFTLNSSPFSGIPYAKNSYLSRKFIFQLLFFEAQKF